MVNLIINSFHMHLHI